MTETPAEFEILASDVLSLIQDVIDTIQVSSYCRANKPMAVEDVLRMFDATEDHAIKKLVEAKRMLEARKPAAAGGDESETRLMRWMRSQGIPFTRLGPSMTLIVAGDAADSKAC